MKTEFVPYELSLRLKELGFNEPCFATWSGETLDMSLQIPSDDYFTKAPTFSQAFRFFREKYELFHSTNYQDDNSGPGCFDYEILNKRGKTQVEDDGSEFKTYEEAELACLIRLIEIVEKKQENDK